MVAKKRAKKREIKKISSRKLKTPKTRSNISVVVKNLFLFIILSGISYLLYAYFFKNPFLISLFYITSMIFGFMAVGFLIAFLILIAIRFVTRKNLIMKPVSAKRKKSSKRKKEIKYTLVE